MGVVISPDSRYAFTTAEGVGSAPGKVDVFDLKALAKVGTVDVRQHSTKGQTRFTGGAMELQEGRGKSSLTLFSSTSTASSSGPLRPARSQASARQTTGTSSAHSAAVNTRWLACGRRSSNARRDRRSPRSRPPADRSGP